MAGEKGKQLEVPGLPPRISDREAVEETLNHTVGAIMQLEKDLRAARVLERRLRAQLATLPREG